MEVESIGPVASLEELEAATDILKEKHNGSLLLFRGQNQLYDSIRSGRSRPHYKPQPLVEAGWSSLASKLLNLPIAETHSGKVQAILQHYGCATNFVDLTSNVNVAAWFATHQYSSSPLNWIGNAFRMLDIGKYTPLSQGKAYVLVLSIPNYKELQKRDRLVDLSELPEAFSRPSRQKAWLLMDRPPTKPLPNDFWVATIELDLIAFLGSDLDTEKLFPPPEADGAFRELSRLPFAQVPADYFDSIKQADDSNPDDGGKEKPFLEGFCMAERLLNLPEYSDQHDHTWIDLTLYEPHPFRMWKKWRKGLGEIYEGVSAEFGDTLKITVSPTAREILDTSEDALLSWPELGADGYFFTFAELDHDKVIEHSPPYQGVWLQRDSDLILEVPMSSDGETMTTHFGHPYFLRKGKLTREAMDTACSCGDPDSHDERVTSVLRLQHLVKEGQLILLQHPFPRFSEIWYYVISGNEAAAMDKQVLQGRMMHAAIMNQLRGHPKKTSETEGEADETQQESDKSR